MQTQNTPNYNEIFTVQMTQYSVFIFQRSQVPRDNKTIEWLPNNYHITYIALLIIQCLVL